MHLLFVCTACAEIRLKHMFNTVVDQPNENACKDQMKLKKVSKYMAEAMTIRKKKLKISLYSNVVDNVLL